MKHICQHNLSCVSSNLMNYLTKNKKKDLFSLAFPCFPLFSLVFPCFPLFSLAFPCFLLFLVIALYSSSFALYCSIFCSILFMLFCFSFFDCDSFEVSRRLKNNLECPLAGGTLPCSWQVLPNERHHSV